MNGDISIDEYVDLLRQTIGARHGKVLDAVGEGLRRNYESKYKFWDTEEKFLLIVEELRLVIPMMAGAMDQNLIAKIRKDYGINGVDPAKPDPFEDPDLTQLGLMIYVNMDLERSLDIAYRLETDYGVTDTDTLYELAETVELDMRLHFKGDIDAYFSELKRTLPHSGNARAKVDELGRVLLEKLNARGGYKPTKPTYF